MEEKKEKGEEAPNFPAFPYKPYAIQIDFMNALYHSLNKGGLSMLESPTGTGKTLSIICSALQWVVDRRQQQKTEDRIESDRNGAKDGQGEEMKTKKKEKFGVGFRRVDKRRNHENCRDLFSQSVEEEPCTKIEGNNLQMSNDAVELSDEDFLVEIMKAKRKGIWVVGS
ncbi:hypothetical protein Pyn_22648 [Prunus yedoensis var. nudiflora]|uniref:Helicase ATP-binding domain-containing protein n=1 Tax=Prunus yedoensis var. nudiflora TaxID=2094558 RepID=A0A314UCL7_PRUYE|nr:hypothetical protein Pyn_22648 [Prunus yedoensis var. nudiflora]